MNSLVTVVVVNWNGIKDTIECLDSLMCLDYDRFNIIVVDNGSCDGSGDIIKHKYPDVLVIRNEDNLGYTEANNIGIRYALNNGAEYICILNNDTIVDKHFISTAIAAFNKYNNVGMVGPKILSYHKRNVLWYAGPKTTWIYGRLIDIGHRGYGEIDCGQYDQTKTVGFITGCAFVLHRDVIKKVGYLDNRYFAYFEDIDYCLRAKYAHYNLVYEPKSIVWHKAKSSSFDINTYSSVSMYFGVRNRLLFMKQHGTRYGWVIFIPFMILYMLLTYLTYLYSGNMSVVKPIIYGIKDCMCGKFGAGSVRVFR